MSAKEQKSLSLQRKYHKFLYFFLSCDSSRVSVFWIENHSKPLLKHKYNFLYNLSNFYSHKASFPLPPPIPFFPFNFSLFPSTDEIEKLCEYLLCILTYMRQS